MKQADFIDRLKDLTGQESFDGMLGELERACGNAKFPMAIMLQISESGLYNAMASGVLDGDPELLQKLQTIKGVLGHYQGGIDSKIDEVKELEMRKKLLKELKDGQQPTGTDKGAD